MASDKAQRDAAPNAPRMQRSAGSGRIAVKAGPDGATRLADLYQKANAKIRVPRQHAARLEAVLINTAGGLTGGDALDWQAQAGTNTHLIVTTQACERIYKTSGGPARQTTRIAVGDNARLDWLPQETILFDRSALHRTLEVDLAPSALFTGIETLVLGRAAMGETVHHTDLRDRWRIRRNSLLTHADDVRLTGALSDLAQKSALLAGARALATIVHCAPLDGEQGSALAARLRETLDPLAANGAKAGVSALPGKCIIRLMAPDLQAMRPLSVAALNVVRHGMPLPTVFNL